MTKILFYVSCFFMVNQNNIFNAKTGFFSSINVILFPIISIFKLVLQKRWKNKQTNSKPHIIIIIIII